MIKRPGNEFVIVDNSGQYYTTETPEMAPLMLTVSSFDKGPEDWVEVSGDDFFKLFGENISFEKHGQPAIQAANIIRNGGRLLIKRAAASDATLANAIILATVKKVQVPKVDPVTNEPIYIDKTSGTETTEASSSAGKNDRAVINTADITYSVTSIAGAKTLNELKLAAKNLIVEKDPFIDTDTTEPEPPVEDDPNEGIATMSIEDDIKNKSVPSSIPGNVPFPVGLLGDEATVSEYTYPLFIIADNGRGVSSKRINIAPDYAISKNVKFVLYKLTNLGSLNLDNEYIRFALNPDTIYQSSNMSLSESGKGMVQIQAAGMNEGINKFIDKVSEFSGIERETLVTMDALFGRNNKGEPISQITVNEDGFDLTSEFGITLQNGTNGSFGSYPFGSEEYTQRLIEIYSGVDDPTIFDVEQWKIEVCVDANYPIEVKKVITELVDFRKDFTFIRDMGLGLESFDAISLINKSFKDSMYAATYCQSYDVIDEFTKRQVSVTICYDIARLLIDHLNYRRNAPFCGQIYSVNMPSVVDGTISYIPRILPTVDQKQQLYDMHINYATIVNGLLTLETQVNSQTEETQCSWINNIFVVQNIIRDIRTLCPRIRYSFINQSSGLEAYASDVDRVLTQHLDEVDALSFEYTADKLELANHIFNATISVKFKEYVDFEKFTIFVID